MKPQDSNRNRQSWWRPALFALGLLMASATAIGHLNAAPSDNEVKLAVENHILFDSSVPSNNIDIDTVEGIVTLGGTVPNLIAKDRAAVIAESVKGVRSVVNNISVEPAFRSDGAIRRDIESALRSDPATESREVGVSVANGVATLTGNVDSWQEKQLSEFVAKSVKGVKALRNEINVAYTDDRPDSEIAADIRAILERDVWVDSALVNAEVKDGYVTLSGTVGSAAEKTRAWSDAWTAGVKAVNATGLEVVPWATVSTRKPPKVADKSDEEVKNAVNDALRYDPRVSSFNLLVSVRDGVVTLSGVVDNLKAKNAAAQDAKNTAGVWRVKNQLKVRDTNPPPDGSLARDVNRALLRDPVLDRHQIAVVANKGTVDLDGTVDSHYEKIHAEDVVSRVKGVVDVNNKLDVSHPSYGYYYLPQSPYYYEPNTYNRPPSSAPRPYTDDAEVKDEIEEQMFWSPYVDANSVKVAVTNGVATLTGTVSDWNEYFSATENAYEGGARSVINLLKVD